MDWPTWKMANNRFLFRWPGGKGMDWLFGKSIGSTVGWIKHRNCSGCPDSCSQNWLYWNDNLKKWYLDTKIHVTTNDMSTTCSSGSLDSWIYIVAGIVGFIILLFGIICSFEC